MKNAFSIFALLIFSLPTYCFAEASQFKITKVEPKSVYAQYGFKQGDILKSYNDKSLKDEKDIKALLKKLLKIPGPLKLEIERNGELLVLDIDVKYKGPEKDGRTKAEVESIQ